MNENDTIPNLNVRRRRQPGMNLPVTGAAVPGLHVGQRPMTPEEWQADQDHKQRQHAKGWIAARKREIEERQATNAALEQTQAKPVGHGLKSMSEEIDQVPERLVVPPDPGDLPPEKAPGRRLRVAARGPVVDEDGKVISEGDVPVKHTRTKKVSKVALARKAARLNKVLS